MNLVNFLSPKSTNSFSPLFEIICIIELTFIILAFASSLVVISAVHKSSKLHRLVRLRLIVGILVACMYLSSRIAVMHHQFVGPSYYVETMTLIIGTLVKETFLGYMTMLISILSLDRYVATKAWAWYESSPPSTLIFFAVQESILFSVSLPLAYLYLCERITGMQAVYCFVVIVSIGAILFVLVYRLNLREVREIKRGAVIHRYSISRTYQIRENISVFSSFAKLSQPLVIVSIPPMIFYPIYELVPPNIGYDGIRFFSVAMYDLWLAIASCVVISCLPVFFPQLKQSMNQFRFLRTSNKIRASNNLGIPNADNIGKLKCKNQMEKQIRLPVMRYLQFVEALERINIVCGVLFNVVLIILIKKFSRSNLGTYKYLLYVFAIYDIFVSIVHAVIDHQVILFDTMFIAVSRSFAETRILTAFFCASLTVPFALVIINFLYRFWAVRHPDRIRWFSNKLLCCALAFVCFLAAAAWFCVVFFGCTGQEESWAKTTARMEYRRQYGETIMEGYVLMEHWKDDKFNLRPALVLLYFDAVIISCIIIAYSIAYCTLHCIRKAEQMSGYTRVLQGRLLIALCAQTAVPVLSVYIPFFFVLSFPFFGVSAYPLTGSMIILNSCFPPVDAIVIIALMTDYRNGLASVFLKIIGRGEERHSTTSVATTQSISWLPAL